MMENQYLDLLSQNMFTAVKVSLPYLITLLAVGLIVGLIQAATQVNESATPFVLKFLALALVLFLFGSWTTQTLADSFRQNIIAIGTQKGPPIPTKAQDKN